MQVKKVHIVSLGCPKNLVDSEVMATSLADGGYQLTDRPEEATVIVVNTCAFIGPAKEESIEEILRMAAWKSGENNPCTHLVVSGCLPQRYEQGLAEALPEVDLFLGVSEAPRLAERLNKLLGASTPQGSGCSNRSFIGKPTYLMNAADRRLPAPQTSAYIKIADGCSNCCSYCVIPTIRGKARSRTVDDVVKEAQQLAAQGVRELIVTAQDTTAYGRDLKGKPTLALLLKELATIKDLAWIRLLYTYPAHLTEELFRVMAAEEKICHYIDIPIQHSDDAVLKAMHRQGDAAQIRQAIAMARALVPDIAVRTSLIVGFPGETLRRFEGMLDFVHELRFDHLGIFTYSREEGTPAADLPVRISEREKERRRGLVMEEQALISRAINQTLIGTRQEVLIEGKSDLAGYTLVGRCRRQAPDIDGVTHLRKGKNLKPGSIINCRITGADDYDLFAEPV